MANKQVFKVLNMNCNHCVRTIEKALKTIDGIEELAFNLEEKKIQVFGDVSSEVIIETITQAGYEVEK